VELAIFNYSACINSNTEENELKKEIDSFFSHHPTKKLSALFSEDARTLTEFSQTTARLFDKTHSTNDLPEKRCYEDFQVYIFKLNGEAPPFLLLQSNQQAMDTVKMGALFSCVCEFYESINISVRDKHYYSDNFHHYIAAKDMQGISSHWVSPTTALQDAFQIRATSPDTSCHTHQKTASLPFNTPLLQKEIDNLETLLNRALMTFPPSSAPKKELIKLKNDILNIAKANQYGSLREACHQFITCITSNASSIRLKRRVPVHSKKRSKETLRTRLTSFCFKSPPPPTQKSTTSPLLVLLNLLDTLIKEMNLDHLIKVDPV
jgi:hypothetical protein